MPTADPLSEMAHTGLNAVRAMDTDNQYEMTKEMLRAVLRKHIEPLLDEAYEAGCEFGLSDDKKGPTGRTYAARVIKALTDV